jgi:argininosuccinate lyase
MGKLWQKDYSLDQVVEHFTVGEDYLLDRNLVNGDCVSGIAHAAMLETIGILTKYEFKSLKNELVNIIEQNDSGEFSILPGHEDCHTAIENHLTGVLGEAGKKIHTGRSRNDQVIAAIRLYSRGFLLEFQRECLKLTSTLINFAGTNSNVPMPGRTHMQIAMPSSVGLWAGAYAEGLLDDISLVAAAYSLNNMCPLGSAASYGVPLPINREMVAQALGFKRVQNNVLYVNNSRGKIESVILDALEQVMITLSKMAQDLILFSMPEFRYFSLPVELCTGSSIMPQKKNPAALELIRAKASAVSAFSMQIKSIIKGLPSGYNRDFQDTKAPFIKGLNSSINCVRVMDLIIRRVKVNENKLLEGFIPEIFATDKAIELVGRGIPFRDAYRQVSLNLRGLENEDPYEAIRKKIHTGATGNLGLDASRNRINEFESSLESEAARVEKRITGLAGFKVSLFKPEQSVCHVPVA